MCFMSLKSFMFPPSMTPKPVLRISANGFFQQFNVFVGDLISKHFVSIFKFVTFY